MPLEQLVGAALDALGVSPQARAAERARAEEYYNRGYASLQEGVPLKEAGIDPAVVERTLGPDYAAHLVGYEKGNAFKQAAQSRQTRDFLRSSIEGFLSGPETQTIEGITPEEAEGFFPRLAGPGIGGPESIATAALTRPGIETIGQRFESLPAGLQSLYAGPATAAQSTGRQALERVQVPRVGQTKRDLEIRGGQLDVSQRGQTLDEQKFQASRVEAVRQRRDTRAARMETNRRTLAITHPGLTPRQVEKVVRFREHPNAATEKALGDLADVPGIVKSAAGGVKRTQTVKRVNDVFDRIPTFVKSAQGKKQAAQFDDQTLAGENDSALREAVVALREDFTAAGLPPEQMQQAVAQEIAERATFAVKRGYQLIAVPFGELTPDEQNAKLRLIEQVLSSSGAGGGGSERVNSYLQRATGQAAPAAAAPSATSPAPAPALGPEVQRGTRLGDLNAQAAQQQLLQANREEQERRLQQHMRR